MKTDLITYKIDQSNFKLKPMKRVKGKPFATKMPGTYAIRESESIWTIDNLETGCAVCFGFTEEDVTKSFRSLVRKHGYDGFKKQIAKVKRRMTRKKNAKEKP
jgi:hypothetical protein